MSNIIKKSVEEWLYAVSYEEKIGYIPSDFALKFVTFIKLVNGGKGEENVTPVIHYKMLDNIYGTKQNIANLCYRGSAKTTVMGEYLILYIATYGGIDGFGDIPLGLYVSDSIENGVKNMRKNLEYRWENSPFLQKYLPRTRFTDIRWEFENADDKVTVFKGYGARALSLDTKLYTKDGYTSIGECVVGQEIFGPDGNLAKITAKSEVFNKPMYKLELEDGRFLKVSEDHINSVMVNTSPNGIAKWEEQDLTTKELLNIGWMHTKIGNKNHKGTSSKCILKVKNTEPLEHTKKDLPIDPYTLGLILGDGSIKNNASGIVLTGLKGDTDFYRLHISYEQGKDCIDKRTTSVNTFAIKNLNQTVRNLKIDKDGSYHGDTKYIPEEYYFGSIEQRLSLLQGLLDTDGHIFKSGRIDFASASKQLAEDVMRLVRSLGGKAKLHIKINEQGKQVYRPEIWIGLNPFKLPRKVSRYKKNRQHWDNVNVVDIKRIDDESSQCIAVNSSSHQFLAGEYFRTHNTGVRGAKEMGQRPLIAILDDLISDEDSRSETVRASIEDTVYKAIDYALHPTKRKIIWSGTPFNAKDPLYKAVESGGWYVNVYPVCEKFPCTREEFRGSWEERFTYDFVKSQYDKSMATGKIAAFNQELMLRIMSDEDRLINDDDIVPYNRGSVLLNKDKYNFYITTDFATSEKKSADYSVISVWAYNNNGDWLWVDGICKRQNMSKNIDDLFRFINIYKPQSVGIEITGQQGGFINWIQNEMVRRNIYFNLASEGNNLGLRPKTNKMERFNVIVPLFKMRKIWFPSNMDTSECLIEAMDELRNASINGFKSRHDDFIDTISMLALMNPWKPSEEVEYEYKDNTWVEFEEKQNNTNSLIF